MSSPRPSEAGSRTVLVSANPLETCRDAPVLECERSGYFFICFPVPREGLAHPVPVSTPHRTPPPPARLPREHSSQVHPWASLATDQGCLLFIRTPRWGIVRPCCSRQLLGDVTSPGGLSGAHLRPNPTRPAALTEETTVGRGGAPPTGFSWSTPRDSGNLEMKR